jgi:hypothetical protein
MVERLAKPKPRTAAPSDLVSVKVRMKESQRRIYMVEADRDGISVNQVIERRLNRTRTDDAMEKIIKETAKATALEYHAMVQREMASQIRDMEVRFGGHILNLQYFMTNAINSKKEK